MSKWLVIIVLCALALALSTGDVLALNCHRYTNRILAVDPSQVYIKPMPAGQTQCLYHQKLGFLAGTLKGRKFTPVFYKKLKRLKAELSFRVEICRKIRRVLAQRHTRNSYCVQTPTPPAVCGDGVIEAPEGCDDGNSAARDGCGSTCQVEANWVCSGQPSVCSPAPTGLPIGIPAPPFGLSETHLMYQGSSFDFGSGPEPYRDSGSGPYTHYVDNTNPAATDDSNPFGTPSLPRLTVPRDLPPGSVVEVHGGPYTYINYPDGTVAFSGQGTAERPIFIRGASSEAKPRFTHGGSGYYEGAAYMIIENLDLFSFGILGASESLNLDTHHVVLRDCEVRGDLSRGGVAVVTWTPNKVHEIVVYRNKIHDNGDINANYDQDVHGIGVGGEIDHLWVLNNEMYRNSGDGIQINCGADWVNGAGQCHHIYVGHNTAHHNKQTGFWSKQAHDVIFSQNTSFAHRPGNSSYGAGMGFQYGPERVWFIFNHIFDCEDGIAFSSDSVEHPGQNTYIVGNLIHDIHHSGEYNPNTGWSQAAIMTAGGVNRFIVNNTIYDVDAGINAPGGGSYHIANNIIADVTESAGNHIFIEDEGATVSWRMENNLLYEGGQAERVRFQGQVYSIAQVEQILGRGANNLNADPLFINPAEANFAIPLLSPAVDRGIADEVYQTFAALYGVSLEFDIGGTARPQAAAFDLGAFEAH